MPKKIFISYRRDDSKWVASNLHTALCQHLPSDHVFMDTTMPVGVNFPSFLES